MNARPSPHDPPLVCSGMELSKISTAIFKAPECKSAVLSQKPGLGNQEFWDRTAFLQSEKCCTIPIFLLGTQKTVLSDPVPGRLGF